MRRLTVPIILGFTLLMMAFVYLAQAAFIVQLIGKVDKVEGKAEVQRQGKGPWFRLEEEHYVRTGDMVRTGDDGRVEIRWLDGTRIRVEPGSCLKVRKCTMNTLKKSKRSEFRLDVGKVWIRIIKRLSPDSKFEIATPTTTAAVRGTIFNVAVDNSGATSVSVFEGTVNVVTRRRVTPVAAGLAVYLPSAEVKSQPTQQTESERREWLNQTGIITPGLNVREPADEAEVTTATIRVSGTVEPTATLTINGQLVRRTRGKPDQFEHVVTLHPGMNEIRVMATDTAGKTTEVVRHVTLAGSDSSTQVPSSPASSDTSINPQETTEAPRVGN
jgi:hypothetical protein